MGGAGGGKVASGGVGTPATGTTVGAVAETAGSVGLGLTETGVLATGRPLEASGVATGSNMGADGAAADDAGREFVGTACGGEDATVTGTVDLPLPAGESFNR